MYKCLTHFVDINDDERHEYNPGDKYPRDGLNVSEERIKELAGCSNRRGKPVIVEESESWGKGSTENTVYFPEKPDDFSRYMNPPEEPEVKPDKEPVRVEEKPRRGRRKKTDAVK